MIVNIFLLIFGIYEITTALKCSFAKKPPQGCARFGVMTDMHYYPANLVNCNSPVYQNYLKQDAKLTEESGAVIDAAINAMLACEVEFVILAGDLTNEGEKQSHLELAELLHKFTQKGIQVFVTPGNHDINNRLAMSYLNNEQTPIDTINEHDFEEIYYNFGFKQAYSRDVDTLSYCARVKEGLNIITIDANQYKNNKDKPLPDGILSDDSVTWAENEIRSSLKRGERIIGVMHHGLVEHFENQGKSFRAFLVNDFDKIGQRLVEAGLDFVFTGHLHAQDISSAIYNGKSITDIETAALTSVPFAWRLCCINHDELIIETRYIDEIDFDYGSDLPFRKWATQRVWEGLLELEAYFLKQYNGLTEEQTKIAAPYYARAFMAHFCGDENPSQEDKEFYLKHKNDPQSPYYEVAKIFSALWTDLPDSDNDLTLHLRHID
ncbi:MAG: metallophosphoesterase [Candidatus Cloacimonetes bacterium]|nr:metallophosphoesterase [Candidatus Cloacimonadota bacterium]